MIKKDYNSKAESSNSNPKPQNKFNFLLSIFSLFLYCSCDSENRYLGNPLRGTCYCKYPGCTPESPLPPRTPDTHTQTHTRTHKHAHTLHNTAPTSLLLSHFFTHLRISMTFDPTVGTPRRQMEAFT